MRCRIAIGWMLLAIGLLGVGIAGARAVVRISLRHVVVDTFDVGSTEQVFVDCEQAASFSPQEQHGRSDLGWIPSEERIYVSAMSLDQHPTWGFVVTQNESIALERGRTPAEALESSTEKDALVFAQAVTAGGDGRLGQQGCQKPGVVADELRGYVQAPEDNMVRRAPNSESPYRGRHAPYDQIDALGRWSLTVLAAIGFLATIGIGPVRRILRSEIGAIITGLMILATFISLFVGAIEWSTLVAALTFLGTGALFAAALLRLLPSLYRRLERAANPDATEAKAGS
jgi:hypothetical protein